MFEFIICLYANCKNRCQQIKIMTFRWNEKRSFFHACLIEYFFVFMIFTSLQSRQKVYHIFKYTTVQKSQFLSDCHQIWYTARSIEVKFEDGLSGSNFNNFSTTSLIVELKVSLDRAHQDLKLCLWDSPLELTPRTIEPILQNLRQIS